MTILNNSYDLSCKPSYNTYKKLPHNTFLIDNFFENFEDARNFFLNLQKWKCVSFQKHSKSGWESLLPTWVGRSLLEKFVYDNKISDDIFSYTSIVDYRFDNDDEVWSISHSNYFPHYDSILDDHIQLICLINLNEVSVSTKFYTYKNNHFCNSELHGSWLNYDFKMNKKIMEFYKDEKISPIKVKNFLALHQEILQHKFSHQISYKPNQAIIYQSNMLHSPNVTENFDIENPRSLLRISFLCKRKTDDLQFFYY